MRKSSCTPIELSCLGFTSKNMVKFSKLVRTANININRLISKCSEVCCRTTYYVYNRRGKSWSAPPTMKYTWMWLWLSIYVDIFTSLLSRWTGDYGFIIYLLSCCPDSRDNTVEKYLFQQIEINLQFKNIIIIDIYSDKYLFTKCCKGCIKYNTGWHSSLHYMIRQRFNCFTISCFQQNSYIHQLDHTSFQRLYQVLTMLKITKRKMA